MIDNNKYIYIYKKKKQMDEKWATQVMQAMQPCKSYKSCLECLMGQVGLSDLGGSKVVPNRPTVPKWA